MKAHEHHTSCKDAATTTHHTPGEGEPLILDGESLDTLRALAVRWHVTPRQALRKIIGSACRD